MNSIAKAIDKSTRDAANAIKKAGEAAVSAVGVANEVPITHGAKDSFLSNEKYGYDVRKVEHVLNDYSPADILFQMFEMAFVDGRERHPTIRECDNEAIP